MTIISRLTGMAQSRQDHDQAHETLCSSTYRSDVAQKVDGPFSGPFTRTVRGGEYPGVKWSPRTAAGRGRAQDCACGRTDWTAGSATVLQSTRVARRCHGVCVVAHPGRQRKPEGAAGTEVAAPSRRQCCHGLHGLAGWLTERPSSIVRDPSSIITEEARPALLTCMDCIGDELDKTATAPIHPSTHCQPGGAPCLGTRTVREGGRVYTLNNFGWWWWIIDIGNGLACVWATLPTPTVREAGDVISR